MIMSRRNSRDTSMCNAVARGHTHNARLLSPVGTVMGGLVSRNGAISRVNGRLNVGPRRVFHLSNFAGSRFLGVVAGSRPACSGTGIVHDV